MSERMVWGQLWEGTFRALDRSDRNCRSLASLLSTDRYGVQGYIRPLFHSSLGSHWGVAPSSCSAIAICSRTCGLARDASVECIRSKVRSIECTDGYIIARYRYHNQHSILVAPQIGNHFFPTFSLVSLWISVTQVRGTLSRRQ
jgi:hypothetical protein